MLLSSRNNFKLFPFFVFLPQITLIGFKSSNLEWSRETCKPPCLTLCQREKDHVVSGSSFVLFSIKRAVLVRRNRLKYDSRKWSRGAECRYHVNNER